jgi:hypothetical protein
MKLSLIAALCAALISVATGSAESAAKPRPIVTVVRHGGLCVTGTECREVLRITDRTISAEGYAPRRLAPGERRALLRAIRRLDLRSVRAHPFTGTCPTAYDGSESIYRFRGVAEPLASCRYELKGVPAVKLTERLLSTLKPR